MRYTEEKVETLITDDDGKVVLDLVVRRYESGANPYYARMRIVAFCLVSRLPLKMG